MQSHFLAFIIAFTLRRMAELNVLKANGRGRLHTVALRPFVPFGAGDRLQTERIAYEDILAQTHDGENRTAFVYCKNAAHWHYLAAKTLAQNPAVGGQAYFISNGEDGVVPVKAMRAGIVKHRKKPIKFDFSLTPTVRCLRAPAIRAHHALWALTVRLASARAFSIIIDAGDDLPWQRRL